MDTPQTAEQINLPQTGSVKVPPPFVPGPSNVAPTKPKIQVRSAPVVPLRKTPAATKAVSSPSPKPVGWWKISGVKGSKDAVVKSIQAQADIPDHWKALLQNVISQHTADAIVVNVHASQENKQVKDATTGVSSTVPGKVVMHIDISPLEGYVA